MKNKPRQTMNRFRQELETMTVEQKKERLAELRSELFIEKSQKIQTKCFLLHRMIAMVKTSLHMKGYGYHPRKGVE